VHAPLEGRGYEELCFQDETYKNKESNNKDNPQFTKGDRNDVLRG
jgi:hypothetical protein